MFQGKLSKCLVVVNALVAVSMSNVAFAATPIAPHRCPDGWVLAQNQIGCIPDNLAPRPSNETIKTPTQSKQIKFPPEMPKDLTYDKCELGIVDPVDCPENNPVSPARD